MISFTIISIIIITSTIIIISIIIIIIIIVIIIIIYDHACFVLTRAAAAPWMRGWVSCRRTRAWSFSPSPALSRSRKLSASPSLLPVAPRRRGV